MMELILGTKTASKRALRTLLPLAVRKRLSTAIRHQGWIGEHRRQWWSVELVRDLAERDIDAYHRFLWSNHLGYAESYEVATRFGADQIKASRRVFFADLLAVLRRLGLSADSDIRSVLEVGCSLGYLLRFMETDLFRGARTLEGFDLDRRAIESGAAHLRAIGSNVSLRCGDVSLLEQMPDRPPYDLLVCTGVLMYLSEPRAASVIRAMLQRSRLVALAGLAHPGMDNARLEHSDSRRRDSTFIHNFDAMVERAGGRVVARRWEGSREVDGNTIYFVFATPHVTEDRFSCAESLDS
jgi:SAM-dependent methyltransferase